MGKKVVGITMGGYSSERKISLNSGNTVYKTLSNENWECYRILISSDSWIVLDNQNNSYPLSIGDFTFSVDNKIIHFDVIFNAIHGIPGENGQLAALLELLKIPHTSCDSYTAGLTFNKRDCLNVAKKWGIPAAKSVSFDKGDIIDQDLIKCQLGFPCFVKPNRSGSSFGIVKVNRQEDFENALDIAFSEDKQLIIESALVGREVSVGVFSMGGEIIVLPITEITTENEFFDYEAKYEGKSEEITPAKIPQKWSDEIIRMSKRLYLKMELSGVCRGEFIIVDEVPHLLEINTIPGLTEASIIPQQLKVAGLGLKDLFEAMLNSALEKNV